LTIHEGSALEVLRRMPTESIHMAVTSPPYWGLRDYGLPSVVFGGDSACPHDWTSVENPENGSDFCQLCNAWMGQLGQEPTPDLYVTHLVEIFRELRRVLRHDGTFWLNIGDSYASYRDQKQVPQTIEGKKERSRPTEEGTAVNRNADVLRAAGIKHKDLIGIPWMLAFALRADGWWLRSDIVWAKPNVMPESVEDRPTKSHESLFLLTKSERYFYDNKAIEEPLVSSPEEYLRAGKSVRDNHAFGAVGGRPLGDRSFATVPTGRNKRTVWFVASQPYKGAHYAPFPPKLIEPTILAGTSEHGVCVTCGAPWIRQVENEPSYDHITSEQSDLSADRNDVNREGHDVRNGVFVSRVTVGFAPTCAHTDGVVPATVLDPFAGSGTTGLVAQKFSRRAVLIDLNGSYVSQQLVRNANVPLGL
jgi:DNA modification methylase